MNYRVEAYINNGFQDLCKYNDEAHYYEFVGAIRAFYISNDIYLNTMEFLFNSAIGVFYE